MNNFPVYVDGQEYWVSRSIAVVSYVYTIKDGVAMVLINKRGHGLPNNVGKWNAPSGFLDYDETLKECGIRETYEETGVRIKHLTLEKIDDDPSRARQNVLVRFSSYVRYQEPNTDHCEPDEVEEVKWVPLSEVCNYDWTSEGHVGRLVEYGQHYENLVRFWKYFEELEPFDGDVTRIPDIPNFNNEKGFYEDVIVYNLIRCGAIPKEKLKEGVTYLGSCRNTSKATWNGKYFVYERNKWGNTYECEINHFQDDDGYDVFVPIKEVE